MSRSPSVRYSQILTFSENRLLVPAFSSTADGQRGTPRRPSADGVTRLPSPLPYVFHLQGIAPKLLTHRGRRGRPPLSLRRRHQGVQRVLQHFHFDVADRRVPVLIQHGPDQFSVDVGPLADQLGEAPLRVFLHRRPVLL